LHWHARRRRRPRRAQHRPDRARGSPARPREGGIVTGAGEGASPLETYYTALDDGDAEAAAAVFAEDALYIRPALPGSPNAGALEVVRGRGEVLAYFRERGKKPFRHRITRSVADGDTWFVEGVAGMRGE